ncbi:MAG TPA: mycothiol system anti-sigma-R factor [Mycobacteriales bacterium]|nr:mycothiol system anti-sigma-R factor [Mycobacteriales bacterium]
MSCGTPHDVDCSEVIEKVYLYLDGEIDDDARHQVREHLDECAPCLRKFGLEQDVKAMVARCCGGETAPQSLRENLIVRLQQVRVELASIEFRAE